MRQRERFAEVAELLRRSQVPCVRRSQLPGPLRDPTAVILVDTIGELGAVWGLADVAFVGKYDPSPIGVNGHRKGLTPEQFVNGPDAD